MMFDVFLAGLMSVGVCGMRVRGNWNNVPIFNVAGLMDRVPIPSLSWYQASKALSHVSVQAEEVGNGWEWLGMVGYGWVWLGGRRVGCLVQCMKTSVGHGQCTKRCCECTCCYTPTLTLRLFDCSIGVRTFYFLFCLMPLQLYQLWTTGT